MAPSASTQQTNPGIVGAVISWFSHPFNTSGSALNWILFVGLLICAAGLWAMVLHDLKEV